MNLWMILIGLIATAAFSKQSISNNLSLLKYSKKDNNVIKIYISIVSLSLNHDLTNVR